MRTRSPALVLVLLVAACEVAPEAEPDSDRWLLSATPRPIDYQEDPCPEYSAPARDIVLRGRDIPATEVLRGRYELVSETEAVTVFSDTGNLRVEGGEAILRFTAAETWPGEASGEETIHNVDYELTERGGVVTGEGHTLLWVWPDGADFDVQCVYLVDIAGERP